ncbi:ABC transporter permease [Paenibacillus sp. H1-7]|uniref:ABC transporter permease n=1 Tax=Paenibacillus sp. H1-7 TaxID=2282849 RepID=UPI001EF868E8|nr:ABC transporter permease [Paenibacillus sp. H1-7]ULL14099.1 ABC transporter permease [Paenibacillus sp. H1-7]
MDMSALYQRRTAEFLKEIRPYAHYAFQGASMAAIVFFLLFSIAYRLFLQWVTPEFPWQPLCAAVLFLALASGRVRTYLQEADTLFLLPQERGMSIYLQTAMRRALLFQLAVTIAAWLLVWPLYGRMTQADGIVFVVLLAVLLLLKWALLNGKWTELQLQEPGTRRGFILLRWLFAALASYALMALKLPYGILTAGAGAILYLAVLRLPHKYTVHWTLLIEMERRHKASIYRLLNWFVDVPQVQGKARSIPLPGLLRRMIPFRQRSSYHYLYTLVWLRSELLGITVRLAVVGIILIVWIQNDWAAAIVYALFGLFAALQLSDLKRYYREHIWHRIYPIPEGMLKHSTGAVRFRIHLAILLLMAVPLCFSLPNPLWAAGLLLLGVAVSWLYHRFR